jgi:aspartyl protease family protein
MISNPAHRGALRRAFLALALCLCLHPAYAAGLRERLETLAQDNGFHVSGLERLGEEDADAPDPGLSLENRVAALLSRYNYMIVGKSGGGIEEIRIASLKQLSPRRSETGVAARRLGDHYQVQAQLTGPNGEPLLVFLLVDTGASTLVLPNSMIRRLGFDPGELTPSVSQTAAGQVAVRLGTLPAVRVGEVEAQDVRVAFIANKRLNGARLLGMSFLNRFRFSLDDEHNRLLLLSK